MTLLANCLNKRFSIYPRQARAGVVTLLRITLLFLFTLSPGTVTAATVPAATSGFSGTFSGKLSGNEVCTPPSTGGPFSTTLTFTITENNGSFTGAGGFIDDGGDSGTFQLVNGSIDANGQVTGGIDIQQQAGVPAAGTFSGSYSDNTLSLSISGADIPPPPAPGACSFTNANGTFTRTSGGDVVITPETPSSVLTAPVLLNTQVRAITGDLNARIGDVLRGIAIGPRKTASGFMWEGQSGLNAGEGIMNYGVWGSYSYSDFENDFASTAFDGHRHNFLAGFDISPWESAVLGVAVGYEGSDIDTGFNGGNQETDGYTVAPYAGFLLTDTLSIDASLGYSNIDSDQFRTDPGTGARVTSSPNADRWFAAMNLNGFTTWGNWLFNGRLGFLHARNITDAFVESNGTSIAEFKTKLGQFNLGGEAAYSFGEFEPFARLTYENDFSMTDITVAGGPQPSNDDDDFLFGGGLRYFGANGLTGNLEYSKRLGRDDFDEDTITATLRMDF